MCKFIGKSNEQILCKLLLRSLSETAKTVLSHLKWIVLTWVAAPRAGMFVFIFDMLGKNWFGEVNMEVRFEVFIYLFSVAKEKCLQQLMLCRVQKIVTPSLFQTELKG